ncbi:integral membrane protein S linking to the trans Golgi network-domain-containing protein [Irpex rosettiformis]|uniref:Integral membrane protein S linking to the trans Golgi network-domain-containing protein n=1 Tax=Irpex rosettiformis TaxID=378272 RepID=A0ACB8UAS8_9APHY|nr:integral membrane protein S linking to the trans Golgi network-domain-containing protein [Irpex rosettiformis]
MAKQNNSSGWDPVLIISQIISLQALHYLTLAVTVSPLLSLFAEPSYLEYEGGAANVGMIMDWRQMAGRPTTGASLADAWKNLHSVWSGGHQVGDSRTALWNGQIDSVRGWIIAACWIAVSGADICYLYLLIRRPRLILDFTLTLLFNHLVLTTYYSSAIPTSLLFWAVMAVSAVLMVVVAEQLCVKREMQEGLQVVSAADGDEMEMGGLLRSE